MRGPSNPVENHAALPDQGHAIPCPANCDGHHRRERVGAHRKSLSHSLLLSPPLPPPPPDSIEDRKRLGEEKADCDRVELSSPQLLAGTRSPMGFPSQTPKCTVPCASPPNAAMRRAQCILAFAMNRCWKWGIVKGGKSKFFDSATSFWHFGFHPMYSKGGWVLALPCTPLQGLLDYKVTHL